MWAPLHTHRSLSMALRVRARVALAASGRLAAHLICLDAHIRAGVLAGIRPKLEKSDCGKAVILEDRKKCKRGLKDESHMGS